MDQQQWERVSDIVDIALDLDGEERKSFIEKECTGDQELKSEVIELLESIQESDITNFLEGQEAFPSHLAGDLPNDNENTYASSLIGEVIDRYKILELIGHGGMGSVFLAKRADAAYDKKVAIKILRRGMDTPSNVARFKRERNILANLDHPNVARLLDGGVTDNGLPYLVMEYVDGIPLLEYCNTHTLSIEERLELFKSVCKAVQHAHRNATIHRDLKPSNIFVTTNGTVKILDFGIAKMLKSNTSDANLFETDTGTRILTLGYAAPEQVENNAITTATDSYTLGILLYELLAGTHPFDLEKKDLSKIEKLIRSQSPTKPSEKFPKLPEEEKEVIASQRNTDPSGLVEILSGDLDAIVMKALRKEPDARYPSVEQMQEDLHRYDESRPLIAQSDTLKYRIGKFVRRNRKNLIGAAILLIAVTGFGSYHIDRITEQRNIAKTEADKAQTVKNFLVDIFRSSNPRSASFEGKDVSAQQLLINGQNRIDQELQGQPDAYIEILVAIGDALSNIDAFKEAEKSYKKALSKAPESSAPLENKINIQVKLGHLILSWKRSEQARPIAYKAQSLLQKMENPPTTLKASVFGLLGDVETVVNNREKGNKYFEKADSLYKSAGLQNSDEYIQMLTEYGRSLLYVFNFEKSEEILLKSNELHRQKYGKPTLTIAENYKHIAWTNRELGNFQRSNNYFKKSIELNKKLTGSKSVLTGKSMYHLARNHTLMGNFEKSEKLAQQVLDIYQEHADSTNTFVHQAKNYIAIAKYNQKKWAEAETLLKNVLEERRKLNYANDMPVAGTSSHLAIVYQNTGQFQKAISILQETIKINEKNLGSHSRGVGVDMIKLADVYRDKEDYQQAEEYFQQAETILKEETPENHYRRAELYFKYAKLKRDMGNAEKAQAYFQKAYNIYLDNFGEDSHRTKKAASFLKNFAEA